MTKALSTEQRVKIVQAYNQGLGTAQEIAAIFGITQRSVFKYVKMYNETGDLAPTPIPGRPPILDEKNLSTIKKIILDSVDGTLEQYRDSFYKITGIMVGITTIHRACVILNFRRKKKFFRS